MRTKKDRTNHLLYYSCFALMLVIGVYLISIMSGDSQLQMMIIILLSFLYLLWSLLHHYLHHTLQSKIVIEYSLIATLGIVISFLLLQ